MARVGVFILLALAALAQATIPTNNAQDGEKVVLRQHRISVVEQKGKPLCKECEKLVMGLKKVVDNPETEQKLRDALTAICNLPVIASFKDRCLDLVNDVVVGIHDLQSILDDPTQVCESIKLCESEAPGVNTISKRLFLSVASKIIQDIRKPSPMMAVDTCTLCTSALGEIKQFLEIPQVIIDIENELEKICKYLGKYENQCKNLIETDITKVFDWIVSALCQPEQTCSALHLCKTTSVFTSLNRLTTAASHPHLNRFLANISTIQTARGVPVVCMACKVGVGAAIKELNRDSVLTSLTTDITNLVCKIMPDSQKAGCFDFLGIYGKAALELTVNEWTPEEICAAAHACSSVALKKLAFLSQVDKSTAGCDVCKALSKTLAFELQQANVQQDIVNVLTQGCLLLPGKYAFKCGDLVIEYVPFAMGYVADFFSRQDVCSVLRLC